MSGVHRSTYYRWRENDSDFDKEADSALEQGVDLVNDLAESKVISGIKKDQMPAIRFWLQHNHPKYYSSTVRHDQHRKKPRFMEGKILHMMEAIRRYREEERLKKEKEEQEKTTTES